MKTSLILCLLFAGAISTAVHATTWDVNVANFQFTPANITIVHGDTVHWQCTLGTHNVHHIGTPSLFTKVIAAAPWDTSVVFASFGDSTFHYVCQVHPTLMQGSITVTPLPTITVTAPNGGELWFVGATRMIDWTSANLGASLVTIELNRDYPGGAWELLAGSSPNTGSLPWLVTGPASSTARIHVLSVDFPAAGDTSDADFSIQPLTAPPALTISSLGDDAILNWQPVPGASSYDVYRSTDPVVDPFPEFVGNTADTTLTDVGIIAGNAKYFYEVRSVAN